MKKTTVYLPDDLHSAVKASAVRDGIAEAEVIRRSIRQSVGAVRKPPRGALFTGDEAIARRAEELLDGFGDR